MAAGQQKPSRIRLAYQPFDSRLFSLRSRISFCTLSDRYEDAWRQGLILQIRQFFEEKSEGAASNLWKILSINNIKYRFSNIQVLRINFPTIIQLQLSFNIIAMATSTSFKDTYCGLIQFQHCVGLVLEELVFNILFVSS